MPGVYLHHPLPPVPLLLLLLVMVLVLLLLRTYFFGLWGRSIHPQLLAMLGVHYWRPRQPGQRGLRILSLDGGGSRGVLTIALLRGVLKELNKEVHEVRWRVGR